MLEDSWKEKIKNDSILEIVRYNYEFKIQQYNDDQIEGKFFE